MHSPRQRRTSSSDRASAVSPSGSRPPARRAGLAARHSGPGHPVRWVARHFRPGFTLIEILIVITIIGILITLAQPSFNRAVTSAKEATLKENLFILRDIIDQFYADNTKYPASLSELVEKGYLRQVPKDPTTGSAESWVLVAAPEDPAQPPGSQQPGIFDVKSGSEGTARDGSRYADW